LHFGAAQQLKNSLSRIRCQDHISLALALHFAIMGLLLGNERETKFHERTDTT